MKIYPCRPTGEIVIQPSKSYLHRLIIMAALSREEVKIENVNYSDDIKATLNALYSMGLIEYKAETDCLLVYPGDGVVKGVVDCGESGSTLRFLIAVALTMNREITFTGGGRLLERPLEAYKKLCYDYDFEYKRVRDKITVSGCLRAGVYRMDGDISSQFISGMLMALTQTVGLSEVHIQGPLESAGYVDITLDVLTHFGVKCKKTGSKFCVAGGVTSPARVYAEGDWSHGANFACMGARYGGLTIKGLNQISFQRDSAIISILKRMGAGIRFERDGIVMEGGSLKDTRITGRDVPDIMPALCTLLGVVEGRHVVSGVSRLRIKESDRVVAICELINNVGGEAFAGNDSIIIDGVKEYKGGSVSSWNDHRIAMAAAVAACYSTGVIELDNGACVSKSAPDFWEEFKSIGGRVEE